VSSLLPPAEHETRHNTIDIANIHAREEEAIFPFRNLGEGPIWQKSSFVFNFSNFQNLKNINNKLNKRLATK
jgi:hypothetical protein